MLSEGMEYPSELQKDGRQKVLRRALSICLLRGAFKSSVRSGKVRQAAGTDSRGVSCTHTVPAGRAPHRNNVQRLGFPSAVWKHCTRAPPLKPGTNGQWRLTKGMAHPPPSPEPTRSISSRHPQEGGGVWGDGLWRNGGWWAVLGERRGGMAGLGDTGLTAAAEAPTDSGGPEASERGIPGAGAGARTPNNGQGRTYRSASATAPDSCSARDLRRPLYSRARSTSRTFCGATLSWGGRGWGQS